MTLADHGARTLPLPASPASPDLPESPDFHPEPKRRRIPPVVRGLGVYMALAAGLGALAGVLWHAVVDLPTYTVGDNGVAATTERGLTEFFAVDAWFCLLGGVCGLVIGLLGWWGFRRLGWWVTLIVLFASNLAALIAWHLGEALGPSNFPARISAAHAGDRLPIDFQLHSHTTVLIWLFGAVLPVLLFSSLSRDVEDETAPVARWRGLWRGGRAGVAPAAALPVAATPPPAEDADDELT